MIGLVFLGVFGCGCLYHACKNASYDGKSKRDAIADGDKYYIDWEGKHRRVDNDHHVCIHTTGVEANWDTVDIDMKTGEILRNYSQEKRNKEIAEAKQYAEQNRKAKEEAIKEGKPFYSSYEITEYTRKNYKILPYTYVYRRTIDDLLLDEDIEHSTAMYDGKFKLLLWRDEKEYAKTWEHSIEKDKENNWLIIRSKYFQKEYNMTEQEIENYAREIGAIL